MNSKMSSRLEQVMQRMAQRVDWESRRKRDEMRVDVTAARDLLDRLGSPDARLRIVHVAGTKGKGSTSLRIAEGLQKAGRTVATYSSPHVERVTERVRIGRDEIDDDALATGLENAFLAQAAASAEASPAERASWFDLMTAAAVYCMAEAGVEWAILEVGLGGRLDSTNAMDGMLAVITNIDLEHTEILGSTRRAIVTEKAGVLRAGCPVVSGVAVRPETGPEEDAGTWLLEYAASLGCPILQVVQQSTIEATNRALAVTVLECLGRRGECDQSGRPLGGHLLAEGAGWFLPGRLEVLSLGQVPVVLDGAHVASSLRQVLADCARDPRLKDRPVLVLGLAYDKPVQSFLKAIAGRVDTVVCTSVASARHRPANDLAAQATEAGIRALTIPDPRAAVAKACACVSEEGWVLVTGSLYLAGAVRSDLVPPETLR